MRSLARALVLVALVAAVPAWPAAAATPTSGARILVQFRSGTTALEREDAVHSIGGVIEREIPSLDVARIVAPQGLGEDPATAANAIARDPRVASAEPDVRVHLAFTPNDPLWSNDPYVGLGEWGPRKILLDRAWDLTGGAQPVTIAVLDTGVDTTHPDLAGVLLPGVRFVTGPAPSCAPSTTVLDDNSHGTHVAGIIAAVGNNGIGISGAAPNARILPLKVMDCTGSGTVGDIAEAIVYAADHGARIVNVSLGSSSASTTLAAAVSYALAHDVLVVAAAGNCGQTSPSCLGMSNAAEYPGAYPGVVAVAATTTTDTIAAFSTRGPQVAIAAPGEHIVSTTPTYETYQSARGATLRYASFSGTSQATPFVSAVAALVMGMDPALTAPEVAARLRGTADDLGLPGIDIAFGAGRVNALRAVSASLPTFGARYDTSAVPRTAAGGVTFAAKVTLTNTSQSIWTAAGTGPVRLSYHWLDAGGNVVVWDGARSPLPLDVLPGTTLAVNATVLAPQTYGTYTLRFDLVRDGVAWFSQKGVAGADTRVSIGSGLGATYAPAARSATIVNGAPATLAVTLTNTGARSWSAHGTQPVHLAAHWLRTDGTVAKWDGARAADFAADVLPGQTVSAELPLTPPDGLGAYVVRLDLVQEGVTWFSTEGVIPRDIPFVVTSGLGATYAPAAIPTLLPGGRASVAVQVRNDGVLAWAAAGTQPVHLAAHVIDGGGAVIRWDGARTAFAFDIVAGMSATSSAIIDAPLVAGAYRARFDLVREGVTWFSAAGVPPVDAPFVVLADYRATLPTGTLGVSRAAPTATITIMNSSGALWSRTGDAPVRVGVHWFDAAGNVLVWDGARTDLTRDVQAGETITLQVALGTPPAGATTLTIDLVSEGARWFGAGQRRAVALLP